MLTLNKLQPGLSLKKYLAKEQKDKNINDKNMDGEVDRTLP